MLQRFLSFSEEKFSKNLWLYFAFIVLVNILFKIIHLDFSPFWYDEIVSVQSASLDFGHIKHVSEWDKNPPFYYYCLSVWIKIFNDSEFTVRLLSVLFSSLSAGILFILSNKYFNKKTALLCSLLYLSSNFLFFYSHEARAYSLVVLLGLISSLLFFKLKNSQSKALIFFLGLTNFLLLYTHYITGLILFFQFVLALFFFEKKSKMWYLYSCIMTTGLIFIRFTQKQFSLIVDFNSPKETFWLKKSDFNYLKEVLSEFLFDQKLVIALLVIVFLSVVILFYKKQIEHKFVIVYAFCLSVGCIVILFLLGKATPIFLDRYLIFSVPFLIILLAYVISHLNPYIAIPITLLLAGWNVYNIDFKTDKGMNYRDTVSFVKSFKASEDLVIVKTKDLKPLFCYYYDRDFLKLKKQDLPEIENIIFCNSWEDVNKDISRFKRIIVIDSFQDYNPNESKFVESISKLKTKRSELKKYKGVRITFYI